MQPSHTEHSLTRAWYRQPIVWLGMLILLGSAAGCIALMLLGAAYDQPQIVEAETIFGVPLRPAAAVSPSARVATESRRRDAHDQAQPHQDSIDSTRIVDRDRD